MSSVTLDKVISYFGHSEKGLCGSVLMSAVPPYRIFGLHVAGDNYNCGFAETIVREQYDDIHFQCELSECKLDLLPSEEAKVKIPEGLPILGCVHASLEPTTSIKTQKCKSLMFDQIYVHTTKPAPLSENDYGLKNKGIEPLTANMSKFVNVPHPFDKDILKDCREELTEQLIFTTKPCFVGMPEVLTMEQVFAGIGCVDGYNPLKMQTSEGFPLCLARKLPPSESPVSFFQDKKSKKGKEWLFDYDETNEGKKLRSVHPLLEDLHAKNMEMRLAGKIPQSVFICTLKDACIDEEKANMGKNRIFANSPVELTIAAKKYFGHFQAAYQQGRIGNSTAIGINPNSLEWTRLANCLLEKGDNIITGDYSGFGDTLDREVMKAVFEVIENWYCYYYSSQPDYEVHKGIRKVIFEEICSAPQLARNVLFQRICGMPSGFALTVEVNDLVNKLYMLYAWKTLTGLGFDVFKRNVYLCCYGDDIIISVTDNYIEMFNFITIKNFLAGQGISFTNTAKDDKDYKFKSIFESTFLKGLFTIHPLNHYRFLYKLPLSSCLEVLNWQWKNCEDRTAEVCFEATRAALLNLYGRGEEDYMFYRQMIFAWFNSRSGSTLFPSSKIPHMMTWQEMDAKLFSC